MATIPSTRHLSLDPAPRRAGQFIPLPPQLQKESTCPHHEGYAAVFFDVAGIHLEAEEVRLRFPRWEGPCPTCGERLIAYASPEHYVAGDW